MEPTPWIAIGISVVSLVTAAATYFRTARWRKQDQTEAKPKFHVTADALGAMIWSAEGNITGTLTEEVIVHVENLSSQAVTLNHASIDCDGAQSDIASAKSLFPARIESGDHIAWKIPGEEFDGFPQGDDANTPVRTQVSIHVSMDPWTNRRPERTWRSRVFSVDRFPAAIDFEDFAPGGYLESEGEKPRRLPPQ